MEKKNWPVYVMSYRCLGVQRQLRLEWHHIPKTRSEEEEVVQCIRENPRDCMSSSTGETFKTLLPDYCIVQYEWWSQDSNLENRQKTDRKPDTEYHISVRFGKLADRSRAGQLWAYSVHVYLNEKTKKYELRDVVCGNSTPDRTEQVEVYKNRTQWPTGATATTAPLAPGLNLVSNFLIVKYGLAG
ncbi:hypothetical protein PABG_12147 [Paracoccidioides brasiliensis Pb03]|nr:hypothetical protein PABG_12147 [Paracoccidioides brasiliensis Pb03]